MSTNTAFASTLHAARVLNRLLVLRAQLVRMNNALEEADE